MSDYSTGTRSSTSFSARSQLQPARTAQTQGAWEAALERSVTVSGVQSTNNPSSSAHTSNDLAYEAAAAAATVVVAAGSEDVSLTAPFNLASTSPSDGNNSANAGLHLPPPHMQARSQSAKRSPRPSTASLAEGRLINIPDALEDLAGTSTAVGHAGKGSPAGTYAFPSLAPPVLSFAELC